MSAGAPPWSSPPNDRRPLTASAADDARLVRSRRLAWLLDSAFRVPGTRFRFGLDPLIGLVPGLGDVITALLSLLIILDASRLGVSRIVRLRMASNIVLYSALGMIPVFGDAWDFFFKSNQRNLALLERHVASGDASARASDWLFVGVLVAAIALAVAVPLTIVAAIAWLAFHGVSPMTP